jgi:hypothetical protein
MVLWCWSQRFSKVYLEVLAFCQIFNLYLVMRETLRGSRSPMVSGLKIATVPYTSYIFWGYTLLVRLRKLLLYARPACCTTLEDAPCDGLGLLGTEGGSCLCDWRLQPLARAVLGLRPPWRTNPTRTRRSGWWEKDGERRRKIRCSWDLV